MRIFADLVVWSLIITMLGVLLYLFCYWIWRSNKVQCPVCKGIKFREIKGRQPMCLKCGWAQDPEDKHPGVYYFPKRKRR